MTSISSLSSSTSTSATSFDPSKGAARFASKIFSDMDTDTDGSVTKDEFVKGLESKGVSSDDASKQYDAIDTEGTGSITQDDLQSAIESGSFKPPRPQGTPPSGGESGSSSVSGASGASGSSGASGVTSSSTTKTYEAADTNEDGSVSQQEQLIYDLSQAQSASSSSTTSKVGTNIDAMA